MSFFPIKIEMTDSKTKLKTTKICHSPASVPSNIPFKVLETNVEIEKRTINELDSEIRRRALQWWAGLSVEEKRCVFYVIVINHIGH